MYENFCALVFKTPRRWVYFSNYEQKCFVVLPACSNIPQYNGLSHIFDNIYELTWF